MADRAVELLRKESLEADAHAERFRTVVKLLEEDPLLRTKIARLLNEPKANGAIFPPRYGEDLPPSDNLAPILAVFKAKGDDAWVSVTEICEATGFNRHVVNMFLREGRHRKMFESDMPSPKRKYFRVLKDQGSGDGPVATKKPTPKRDRSKKKTPEREKKDGQKIIRAKNYPGAEFVLLESGDTKRVK